MAEMVVSVFTFFGRRAANAGVGPAERRHRRVRQSRRCFIGGEKMGA
jgi:hypothetical protein